MKGYRYVRLVTLVTGTCFALLILEQAAFAPLQPGLSVSASKRVDERDYADGLVGNTGGQVNGTPTGCDGVFTFCDTVPLDLGVPGRITDADSYRLVIELSWDDIQKTNDLDLYLYSCTKSPKDDYGSCSRVAFAAKLAGGCCEKISITDLPASHYYILPQNVSGQNLGYHLKVTYIPAPFKPLNRPMTGPTLPAGTTTEKPSPRPSPSPSPAGPTPAPVKTFGPDSAASRFNFPFLTKGEFAKNGSRSLVWIWVVAVALVLTIVPTLVFLTIRRRRANQGMK